MIRQCVQEDGAVLQTAVLRQGQKRVSGEEEQFLLRNGLSGTQMDFSFWTSWWKKEKQNFLYILGSAQGDVQLYGILFLLFSVICNMMSIFTASALFCGKTVDPDRLCAALFWEIHGILRFLTKNLPPILADLVEKK